MTAEIAERERHAREQSGNALRDRQSRTFEIGDETLTVRVRESARARTARIIVGPRRPLELIVPTGTRDGDVDGFLEAKRRWIERKVAVAREIAARPPRLGLERPGVIWLDGEEVPLERENGRRSMATMGDGRLVVRGEDEQASRAIERWYRREARRRIEQVAVHEAARLGLAYHSLGIRDPRTRWGSCSRRGHLSFSWRLAAAPPDVLRYVVLHELCHLREPSHSKAFWRLLEAARPGWQEQARWLREHGQGLHDFTLRAALTS
jgi:predicted metal-dependent hydrolase